MDRKYEVMFIVRPDVADDELEKLLQALETNVGNAGGRITAIERMGKRRLAYTVRKCQEGIYVLANLEGPGNMLKEIERRLRVQELVIKFITVRTDEDEKRLAKIKKLRESRVKGRGTHAVRESSEAVAESGPDAAPAAV